MTETIDVRRSDVAFPRGADSIRGYLAAAPSGTAGPAIVLIPDVHGLSDLYREIAGRFASHGTAALVIDLYSREGVPKLTDPGEVSRWIASLPDRRVLADVQAAVDWLAAGAGFDPRSIGVTGFCMGGQYALLCACRVRGIRACVSFYGMLRYGERNERKPESPLDAAKDLDCPYLGIFGEEDGLIPLSDVAELRKRLAAAGKSFEVITYPGCGHAFLNHARPDAYRPQAAEDALGKAVEFFQKHLQSQA